MPSTSDRLHLPPLSSHIRVLNKDESDRLDEKFPSLPKSLKDCVTCRGNKSFRWWVDLESDEIGEYECPCAEQFVLHKYLLNAGLGVRLQRYSIRDLTSVPIEAMNLFADYIENRDFYLGQGHGFLLHGDRGTGKTLLASLMMKRMLNFGVDGYFTTFTDLLDNFAAGWQDDKQKQWFDIRVRNAPLLVVDDIGMEHPNRVAMAANSVDNIFRTRVNNALPTIITTNLSNDELARRYSTALETIAGNAQEYEFTGDTWRNSAGWNTRLNKEKHNHLTRPIMID